MNSSILNNPVIILCLFILLLCINIYTYSCMNLYLIFLFFFFCLKCVCTVDVCGNLYFNCIAIWYRMHVTNVFCWFKHLLHTSIYLWHENSFLERCVRIDCIAFGDATLRIAVKHSKWWRLTVGWNEIDGLFDFRIRGGSGFRVPRAGGCI